MSVDINDPRTFQVLQDRDGFYIADDEGLPVETHPERRYNSVTVAKAVLDEMVADHTKMLRQEDDASLESFWSGDDL